MARRIFERKPQKHVDVGSRVDGFVAHVAVFRPIEVFDIRPIENKTPNIIFRQADLMRPAPALQNYSDSVSCLHVLEHLGLGRYGDRIDIDGYARGFDVLSGIVQPGGMLYVSVPIGRERIEFNGHRVFSVQTILDLARDRFALRAFSYVDDRGDLHEDVQFTKAEASCSFGLNYGCGIFEFVKHG